MTSSQPTLMLIDGLSLAFRAFYALPADSFRTSAGQHTNAIHGFISMLVKLIDTERPEAIGVAFDVSRHSFRTEQYPEYKGTRGDTPQEFIGQIPLLQEALHAMGIRSIEKEQYEADDILATLATQGAQHGYRVLVVSGDRDTIQLVDEHVTLLYPSKQGVSELTRYDVARVIERYGVRPEQYPEIAALVGESSDNLPGIPRVGEKTAVKWIVQFGSLAQLLARQDEVPGKVGENLREHAHLAERNRRLNRLVRDVDLDVTPEQLVRADIDLAAVQRLFAKLEFRSLLQRVAKLAAAQNGDHAAGGLTEADPVALAPEATPPVARTLLGAELAAWLRQADSPALMIAAVDSIGSADSDADAARATVLDVGIATPEQTLLLRWQPGASEHAPFEAWLVSDAPKIVWNAKQQFVLSADTGVPIGGVVGDGLIACWLLQPASGAQTLESAVLRVLQEQLPQADADQLVPDNSMPATIDQQAWYLARLHAAIVSEFTEKISRVYTNIEMPLIAVLHALETRGVQVAVPVLRVHEQDLRDRVAELEKQAFAAIGHEVNLSSPKQLQAVLFEQLEMPKTRKTLRGYSTNAAALAELQRKQPHPFLDALLAHRDANKQHQIVETLLKAVRADSRIHTTLLQTGTATGRLSAAEPNLQNIPVRTESGRRIREAFVHAPSYETLMTADYSQIEMRIMAHLSGDTGLIEAFHAGEDLHRFVGARVFRVRTEEVTAAMRSQVKAMSYGLVYGLSAFGLAAQLNVSAEQARQLMADYFERFGQVRDYLRSVVEQARTDGFTETIFGRRRPFTDLRSSNRVLRSNAERAALNSPIQGSAADIIKIAMIDIERSIGAANLHSRMLLQIHDELMFEVAPGEWGQLETIVRDSMRGAATLSVPLEVQFGRGANWNAAAH